MGVRPSAARLPTIVISRRGDLKTKLAAFERGADDIVAIPFIPVIKIAGLEIDLLNRRVKSGSTRLELTTIEQALLYLLASNPGETLDRDTILDALWGWDYTAESNIVDRHIGNLRMKLKDDWKSPRFIETVAGKGYRFRAAS